MNDTTLRALHIDTGGASSIIELPVHWADLQLALGSHVGGWANRTRYQLCEGGSIGVVGQQDSDGQEPNEVATLLVELMLHTQLGPLLYGPVVIVGDQDGAAADLPLLRAEALHVCAGRLYAALAPTPTGAGCDG